MSATELLLIDLSGISHQIWHVSGKEPDPDYVSTQTLARVRALASQHPHAAVCCDAGKSFRADIDPAYKANRDTENRAPLHHQIRLVEEAAKRDGFAVWKVPGFEADDIIATATVKALAVDTDTTVLIATADKDLLQLVSPRVKVKNTGTGPNAGTVADESVVIAKFGVNPAQIHDWLCLVGDASDNVKGAKLIGPKTATELLARHGSLDAVYAAMDKGVVAGITPNMRTNLMEFRERWPVVSKLIALRYDVEIPFEEIASERTAPPMEADTVGELDYAAEQHTVDAREPFKKGADANDAPLPAEWQNESLRELSGAEAVSALGSATAKVAERITATERPKPGPVVASQGEPAPVSTAPVEFSQQLEPRSMPEAKLLAQMMFESRLFSAYGTPQALLAVILTGREHGMPAMASLRGHHIIEGRACQSADTIAGIVLASKKAKYFKPTRRDAAAAGFKTLRNGDDEDPFELVYTIEEAKLAWKKDQKAWDNSGWGKNPTDMLVARAKAKLARLIYPDVVGGMYAPEEME